MRRSSSRKGIRFAGASSTGGAPIPPPPNCQLNSRGFSTLNSINQTASALFTGLNVQLPGGAQAPKAVQKRNQNEDDYFEEEDEPLAYIPAPGSPSYQGPGEEDEDEDDPLDAFMAGIEKQVKKEAEPEVKDKGRKENKGVRDDIEDEDDEETYYRHAPENPNFGKDEDSEHDDFEYDEDGNPIAPKKSKWIDPLPPIDHSTVVYPSFERNFYEEHEDIKNLSEDRVLDLRNALGIKVSGPEIPKPVSSFGHLGFPEHLMKVIRKSEFTQPTPIQAQRIPIALLGRDIIGIAKTGSGKTAAFLWPMLIHIADQPELKPGDGPIGVILCPTRELVLQIYTEAKKFGKVFNIRVCCCYGGGSKWEQEGAEIVVATPGRMIDMVKMKATNLERVTYLVLDEADRMFDMGFEVQVRSICDHVRPDRQTLLFSATFRKKVEKLARVALADPIRVVQGDIGEANADITQIVMVHPLGGSKWNWLTSNIVEFTATGTVLIFVTKKLNAEELYNNLKLREFEALLLHGDMDQVERNKVISAFRKKECPILVATDVAARNLDIPHIRTVVNFDIARDIDTHTHRIGRTGRAGEKGTAYTLVTEKDTEFVGHLVRNLEAAGQEVPKNLMDLAMKSAWFKKGRFKQGQGKPASKVGLCRGLGYKEAKPSGGSSSGGVTSFVMPTFKPGLISGSLMKNVTPTGTGPAASHLGALEDAFKQQYKSQIVSRICYYSLLDSRKGKDLLRLRLLNRVFQEEATKELLTRPTKYSIRFRDEVSMDQFIELVKRRHEVLGLRPLFPFSSFTFHPCRPGQLDWNTVMIRRFSGMSGGQIRCLEFRAGANSTTMENVVTILSHSPRLVQLKFLWGGWTWSSLTPLTPEQLVRLPSSFHELRDLRLGYEDIKVGEELCTLFELLIRRAPRLKSVRVPVQHNNTHLHMRSLGLLTETHSGNLPLLSCDHSVRITPGMPELTETMKLKFRFREIVISLQNWGLTDLEIVHMKREFLAWLELQSATLISLRLESQEPPLTLPPLPSLQKLGVIGQWASHIEALDPSRYPSLQTLCISISGDDDDDAGRISTGPMGTVEHLSVDSSGRLTGPSWKQTFPNLTSLYFGFDGRHNNEEDAAEASIAFILTHFPALVHLSISLLIQNTNPCLWKVLTGAAPLLPPNSPHLHTISVPTFPPPEPPTRIYEIPSLGNMRALKTLELTGIKTQGTLDAILYMTCAGLLGPLHKLRLTIDDKHLLLVIGDKQKDYSRRLARVHEKVTIYRAGK